MTVAPRHDERLERHVLDAVDVELEHVPDDVRREWDAVLCEDVDVVDRLEPAPEAGAAIELKTCRVWVNDNGSRAGRRRGRWWVSRRAHEVLLDLDGAYLLVVLDADERVLSYVLVRASVLDELLDCRWTSNGNGGGPIEESAQLPWPALLDPEEVVDEVGSG